LADDHKEMRDRVVRELEDEFEMLDAVADGQALLEAASELEPDLCLVDISMPIVSGLEVASRLKKGGSKAKVVFLSIHEDVDFVRAARCRRVSLCHRMASIYCDPGSAVGRTFTSTTVLVSE
jgi:CheY-like chemotaxis protein